MEYISILQLAKILRLSDSTVRTLIKKCELQDLFEVECYKTHKKSKVYKKLILNKNYVGLVKKKIGELYEQKLEERERKRLLNINVRSCLENDMVCQGCTSVNMIACKYFLAKGKEPPIKMDARDAVEKYGSYAERNEYGL